jgi:acetylornithine deacetylase/succinyl-diaminopimelate desuccinylase-like protein
MDQVLDYIKNHQQEFLNDLSSFISIPSVSSIATHNEDTKMAADYVANLLKQLDFEVLKHETEVHPIIFAQKIIDPQKPTVLIYGHYDVQPEDPVNEWETPPFEMVIKDFKIYGRGASDDKGQLLTHINAVKAYRATDTPLPLNIKFVIEGEEECGSESIYNFIDNNKELLAADAVLISDSSMLGKDQPSIIYGLRGCVYFTVIAKAAEIDMHSGSYGGIVQNPINALCEMLGTIKDKDNKILIPNFYDDVAELTDYERDEFSNVPFDKEEIKKIAGLKKLTGEKGFTNIERLWARPTFDINGISGGFTKREGAKTVIPKEAFAKISFRLPPKQNPKRIENIVKNYLAKICPQSIDLTVNVEHSGPPWLADINKPAYEIAGDVLNEVFDKKALFVREPASIPIVKKFDDTLKAACLLIGYGLPDQQIHAPNENLDLDMFMRGIKCNALLFERLSHLKK